MDEREKELVRKSLSGESAAFEELVLPYRRSLLHLAYRMTGDLEEAMDIAQETLLRSFRYLGRFDPERNFRNWLFQIAINLVKDWHRRKNLDPRARQGQIKYISSNNHCFHKTREDAFWHQGTEIHTDINIDIKSCLGKLRPREREVFILRDLEG